MSPDAYGSEDVKNIALGAEVAVESLASGAQKQAVSLEVAHCTGEVP